MKQTFLLLILVTLLSFLSATTITCKVDFKMACSDFKIDACKCVPKDGPGGAAFVTVCDPPKYAICKGEGNSLSCLCSA